MTVTSLIVYYFGICINIRDRDVKSIHISDIDIICKHFRLKAIGSKWLHRCSAIGVFVWKTRWRRFESWHVFFFCSFCLCMCGNVKKGSFIFCI